MDTAALDSRFEKPTPGNEGAFQFTRYSFTGTHKGSLGAAPASGNRITVSGIVIFRLAEGKLAEGRWAWDRVSLLQQIGALPQTIGRAA
jgi:predicted ester cyclase